MLNHSLQTITVECVLKASASRATVTLTDVHFNTSSVHVLHSPLKLVKYLSLAVYFFVKLAQGYHCLSVDLLFF